jgi:DNA-binding MarR family transcriptional regulator
MAWQFYDAQGLLEKFFRLQRLLHRRQMCSFRAHGPFGNPLRGQGRVLSILRMQPIISQKRLSYLLDMRQQSLSELLFKLERGGLIERTQSQDDKRAAIVRLTDKGLAQTADIDDSGADEVFGCLNESEQAQLSDYFDRLIGALTEDSDEAEFGQGDEAPDDPMCRPPFGGFGPRGRSGHPEGCGPHAGFGHPEGCGPRGRGRRGENWHGGRPDTEGGWRGGQREPKESQRDSPPDPSDDGA